MELIIKYFIIFITAIAGVLISALIYHKKSTSQHLICPLGHDCESVIHSPYSKIFAIKIELLGLIYYALIVGGYGFVLFSRNYSEIIMTILFLLTIGAFLFSIYLTCIQVFVLKQSCTWCLISAGLSAIIFIFFDFLNA